MKTGIQLITEERERQISKEGWTPEHDANHVNGEIARAGAAYAYAATLKPPMRESVTGIYSFRNNEIIRGLWPWESQWWKPSDKMRDLVKAGALIAAEIDRLQRIQSNK